MTRTLSRPPARPRDTPPPRRRARRVAGMGLRRLRRMTTALWLLLAVAAASVVAVFVPQERTHAVTLAHWRAGVEGPGAHVTALLDAAGVTDVFGSWWFGLLVAALAASLVACLSVRWRAFVRSARRSPPAGRRLDTLTHRRACDTALPPEAALAVAARTLRRRRWRVRTRAGAETASGHAQVAAQRARSRDAGSLVFHTALPVALGAALAGSALGFTGQVDVAVGEAFADTAVAYDRAAPGRWWTPGDHRGFTVRLEEFATSDHPNGVPAEFRAEVTVVPGDGAAYPATVELNEPLREGGMRVHLARHGLAADLVVRDADGTAVLAGPVRLDETDSGAWVGALPVGFGEEAVVLDLVLLPDARLGDDGAVRAVGGGDDAVLLADAYPGAARVSPGVPGVRATAGAGQAGEREGRTIDRRGGPLGATATVVPGRPALLDGTSWSVELAGVRPWVGFQVARAPGSWLLLAAALVALAGLTVSLRAYPRRVWVEARPRPGGGARLVVAGAARDRPWAFARVFARLADRLTAAVEGRPD